MTFLTFHLIIFLIVGIASIHSTNDIAVCIGGQIARWQPKYIFDDFFNIESHKKYNFYLFFNMQVHNGSASIVYNTDMNNTFEPSFMSKLDEGEAKQYLQTLGDSKLITIAGVNYVSAVSRDRFSMLLGGLPLDRITQYVAVQDTILNMYYHQVNCVKQILEYEESHFMKFDYIISTREDVYFYRPMNLPAIIDRLRTSDKDLDPNKCDIPFKRCLNFWGFNMRFFILTRDNGIRFFGNRLSFYKFLHKIGRTIENPERFELAQANALQLIGCPITVEEFPVTAVRYISPTEMCFIWFEIDRCVPLDVQDFVRENMCIVKRRKSLLIKLAKENPKLLRKYPDVKAGVGNISLTEANKKYTNTYFLRQRKYLHGNVTLTRKTFPKTLLRFTEDPILVEYFWTDRTYP